MSLTLITLEMDVLDASGSPASGTFVAQLSRPLVNGVETVDTDPTDGLVVAGQLLTQANEPFTVVANDDVGTSPTGTLYTLTLTLEAAEPVVWTQSFAHTATTVMLTPPSS